MIHPFLIAQLVALTCGTLLLTLGLAGILWQEQRTLLSEYRDPYDPSSSPSSSWRRRHTRR